jgi:hypothetical protein
MKWCVKKYGGFSYEELDWGCEQYKKTGIEWFYNLIKKLFNQIILF